MFCKFTFINHANEYILFGENNIFVSEKDARNYEWGYAAQYDKITAFTRGINTRTIGVTISGTDAKEKANEIFEKIDRDVVELQAGRLYIGVCSTNPIELAKHYYMNGYFIASSKPMAAKNDLVKIELSFLSDVPFWLKETTFNFAVQEGTESTGKNLDYAHDFPYDFTTSLNILQIVNTNYTATDFRITFYGAVTNPSISIGGHIYEVEADVEEGEYLTIDSINKTVMLTKEYGEVVNCFNNRNRDSYIFEKIPRGTSSVSWDTDFKFDVTLIEQRSEPKWN